MVRLLYRLAECRYCYSEVWLPYPTYREKDLLFFTAVICRACREELEAIFGGHVK